MALPVTYEDLIEKPSSEKVILAWIEPFQRAVTWTLDSGAIYRRSTVIVSGESGIFVIDTIIDTTSLTEAASSALNPGEWYFDSEAATTYIRLADDSNPKNSFVILKLRFFFSDGPFIATHDLTDSGQDVEYQGLIKNDPKFDKEIDPATQLGIALESDGQLELENSHGYFDPIFDKLFWDNKRVVIYSWFPQLPISEKKKLFEGFTEDKAFSPLSVMFNIKDQIFKLRREINLATFSLSDGKISEDILGKPKRRLYGQVKGAVTTSVDQVLDGFDLTGTITGVLDATTLTGIGTLFLDEVSPLDTIKVELISGTVELDVSKVISNTSIILSSTIENNFIGLTAINFPERPFRKFNRTQFLAGHKLRAPSTTITEVIQQNRIRVANVSDLFPLDRILVDGTFTRIIKRITGDVIVLTQSLTSPVIGNTVTKTPISTVFFNQLEFIIDRDFSVVNTTEAKIELNDLAEFNHSQRRTVEGTVTFVNGSRTVTGVSTAFLTEFRSRDWIVSGDINHQIFYEILQIDSDTSMEIRIVYAGGNTSGSANKKNVTIVADESIIIVDCIGKEDASGNWIKTASDVIKDLVQNDAGLTSIDTDSFIQAAVDAPFTMALKLPLDPNDTDRPIIRDIVNLVNKSVFGSLISKSDFDIAYNIINVEKPTDLTELKDDDLVGEAVFRGKTKIRKNIFGRFNHFDADIFSLEEGSTPVEFESEFVTKLIGTDEPLSIDIYLANENDAETIVQRYALFHSLSQALVLVKTKLNLTLKNLGDKIFISLDRLFFRFGATSARKKIGIITKIVKSGANTEIVFTDLANIFNRVGTIADNSSLDFTNADDLEKIKNGYIVDNGTELPNSAATTDDEWGSNIIG